MKAGTMGAFGRIVTGSEVANDDEDYPRRRRRRRRRPRRTRTSERRHGG